MGAVVSCFEAICRTIGSVLMAIVNGIGAVINAIVSGIVALFDIIISCLTCGSRSRRSRVGGGMHTTSTV